MKKNVILIGSGGREHAIADALVRENTVNLYSAMKVKNPGIIRLAKDIVYTESSTEEIINFCIKRAIDFCVVGPEIPLSLGITDRLSEIGIPSASPSQLAARIETDKGYARSLMKKNNIPGQIKYLHTSSLKEALSFSEQLAWKIAIKPIGLTAGKGVKVWKDHLQTPEEVKAYIKKILSTGISGHNSVIIEELLAGQEYTIQLFSDGINGIPTPAIQDHKRANNNDKGPNTGGMGAYSNNDGLLPFLTKDQYNKSVEIARQVITAMYKEGNPFKGILYAQFMLTVNGPKVIEFNARFGDPEAMNILPLLQSSFAAICEAIIAGNLHKDMIKFKSQGSVSCYVVPEGYGTNPKPNREIHINEDQISKSGARLYFASCNLKSETNPKNTVITTTTSRTLGIIGLGDTVFEAQKIVRSAIQNVRGDIFYRTDIGTKKSIQKKVSMMKRIDRYRKLSTLPRK